MVGRIGKILVVDDEIEIKNILVEALTSQGYEAAGFVAGEEALKALRVQAFDVLLTDLMMPGIDGITLVREAMQIDPNVICIMMTGQGTIQTAVDAMKIGAFDYVLKPFRLRTMLPVLTRAMNTRHLRLENVQLREAVAIHELSETIAFTLDPQTVLSKLADGALKQSDADEVSILLPTSDGEDLYVAAVRGEKRERLLGERVPLQESISSWVARERKPLILNGEVSDERFVALWPRPEIRSAVSVPMQVANKLVGIINLNMTNRLRPFTLGQMKALTILAGTAAAALESASLYALVQKAEEKYRSIFENAVEGIFQSSADRRFLTVNPSLARILGYDSPEEVISAFTDIGRKLYVKPELAEEVSRTLEEAGVVQGFEFEAFRKNGEQIWLSLNIRLVRDQTNTPVFREGTIEDITERKLAEAALRESEERYRLLFEGSPQPMWVYDVETLRFLAVNEAAVHHYGYSREEFLAMSIKDICPEEDVQALLETVANNSEGLNDSGNWRHRKKDSTVIEVEITTHLLMFDDRRAELVLANDVTERKRAEIERTRLAAEIERQRQRLNNLVSSVPGVVWEAWGEPDSAHQRIDYVSDYVELMLGYSVEEWLSTPNFWLTIIHPDDREEAARTSAASFGSGNATTMEFRWLRKDGNPVWVESNFVVILDDNNRPLGLRGVNTDISERKRAEEALRQSESQLAEAQRLAHIGSWNWDLPNNILRWSDEHYRIFGIEPGGIDVQYDEVVFKFIHPEDRELVRNEVSKSIETGESFNFYYRIVRSDREERVIHSTGSIENDERGKPTRLFGTAQDVTERRRIEQELRQSEERYRDLVENAHDIIYSQDLEGNYTSMNEAGQQITGYTREEALKLNVTQTVAPENLPKAREMFAKKLAGEEVTAYETEIIAKDGRRIAIEANTKLVMHNGVPVGIQGIARDITERKRMEKALRESEEQLRQSQKMEAIGQLAGGVAHDFNNLLTAINGYSSLAMRRLGDDHPVKPHLEEIKKAGDRAANLTRQLLAFGRKQMLQPLALNLNDIIKDMTKMLKRLIGEDVQLVTRLSPTLHRIKADPGQIEQVLMNLIVNARDAMPTGGTLTIETSNANLNDAYTSKHVDVTPGQFIMLAVSDTGTGMDPETRTRIFEPFFTTKEKGKGTGLGLSTVYGIVKQSGGNVWVYSEVGKGTTFKVYLQQLDNGNDQPVTSVVEPVRLRGSETVLLVEDEDMVRNLACELLQESGYRVLTASGGEEAIQLFKKHKQIDLLITDVVMPKMSGKDVADRLRKINPKTKVLFMSGYTDEAIVHHGIVDSHIAFIQKPFSENVLAQKVREVLDAGNDNKSKPDA